MPETANSSRNARRPRVDRLRTLIWIEEPSFRGCGCSECAWVFNPQGPPAGNSLAEMKQHKTEATLPARTNAEMKQHYERRRDKEFAAHVCGEHPRAKKAKG
jgi:hypothetical protein